MTFRAVHMIAHGRVQGVGFRFFVREQAVPYGIKGWVRNLPDGSVEILAEGENEMLNNFIEKVRIGPVFGTVSDITVEKVEPTDLFNNFSIRF